MVITKQQWLTLFGAQAGYMLDAMDVLLFVFAINVMRDQFHLSATQAGLVSSCTLAFSAVGGIGFGDNDGNPGAGPFGMGIGAGARSG